MDFLRRVRELWSKDRPYVIGNCAVALLLLALFAAALLVKGSYGSLFRGVAILEVAILVLGTVLYWWRYWQRY